MSENNDQRRDSRSTREPLLRVDIDSVEALRALVANDGYAASFQSIGQYRAALLRQLEPLALASLMAGALIRTWRQRIGVNKEWPLHAPNDVERAMVAEIAELRSARANQPAPALDDQLADATNALRKIAENGGEAGKTARAALHVIAAIHRRAAQLDVGHVKGKPHG